MLSLHEHLIVIADRLRALDNLVAGRYWSADGFQQGEAGCRTGIQRNVSRRLKAPDCGKIVYWDEIAETSEFTTFSEQVRRAFFLQRNAFVDPGERYNRSSEPVRFGRVRKGGASFRKGVFTLRGVHEHLLYGDP
jgi:hypothetical protein